MRVVALQFVLFLSAAGVAVGNEGRNAVNRFKGGSTTKSNVVSKVIEMLDAEKAKIAADIEGEAKAMEEYFEYCDDEQKEKVFAIRDSSRTIRESSAVIEDNTAQINALDESIVEIGVQMNDRQKDHDKLKAIRDRRHKEFVKREEEQTIMIGELQSMEEQLKQQIAAMTTPPPVEAPVVEEGGEEAAEAPAAPAEGAEAFVQMGHNKHAGKSGMSKSDLLHMQQLYNQVVKSVLEDPDAAPKGNGAFLQQLEDPMDAQKKGTADNLASFEALTKKAVAALQRERDQEKKEYGEFMVEKQSLMGDMNLMNNKLDDANENKNKLSEEKAKAEETLRGATEAKAADEKYLEELKMQCGDAASAWDSRQKEATAEQAAIQKAMDILGSRVKVLVQVDSHLKGNSVQPQDNARQRLVAHFRNLGTKLHSLSMLNMVNAMSVTPMDNIKKLIGDMIAKLQKEAAEAANMHAFCTEENKKNKEAKEKTQDELDKLQNRFDSASSSKQELEDRVAQLQAEISEIEDADAEALKMRTAENKQFVKDEADFSEAASAVDDAVDALKDYYGDVGIGALLQTKDQQPIAAPPKLGGSKSASAGGILSILDMMSDQFATTVRNLQKAEREATEAYRKLTEENEVSKTAKMQEIKSSESEIMSLTEAIGDYSKDQKQAGKVMDSINEYISKLKPTCENRVVPYAERKAKREAEIEGLKEAFQILVDTSDSMVLLQIHKH